MKYYTDGFVRGKNPSPTGGGYTIVNEAGDLVCRKEILMHGFTCNEAEVLGIYECLKLCFFRDTISTDSMNSLSLIFSGRPKVRPDLNSILESCREMLLEKDINLIWERRNYNLAGRAFLLPEESRNENGDDIREAGQAGGIQVHRDS